MAAPNNVSTVHRYNDTHSDAALIDITRNNSWDDVSDDRLKKLRLYRSNLNGILPANPSNLYLCRGIKRHGPGNLLVLGYHMTLPADVNWDGLKMRFEASLVRHLSIQQFNVDVQAIFSDTNTCWYFIRSTPELEKALNRGQPSFVSGFLRENIVPISVITVIVVVIVGLVVLKPSRSKTRLSSITKR